MYRTCTYFFLGRLAHHKPELILCCVFHQLNVKDLQVRYDNEILCLAVQIAVPYLNMCNVPIYSKLLSQEFDRKWLVTLKSMVPLKG